MQIRLVAALCVAGLVVAAGTVAAGDDQVKQVLVTYCADCHSGSSPEGDVSLDGVARFSDRDPAVWSKIREKVQLGEMPPEDASQPNAGEKQQLLEWIAGELRRSGEVVEDKLTLPNYGNYTDHDALFRQQPTLAPATVARLWRLRPGAYRVSGTQPFSLTPGHQFQDYSTLYTVDESAAEIVLRNAQNLVERQTSVKIESGKVEPASKQTQQRFLPLLHPDEAPTEEQVREALQYQFREVLDREASDEELERTIALMEQVTADVSRLHGVRAALTVPFLKPEALYRFELGAGELDEHGRRRMSQREIAYAISFALTNERPARYNLRPLHDALEKGRLGSREEVAAVVSKLLEEPLDKTPRVLDFFEEYFDYAKATGVFKEKPSFANYLVRDTQALIKDIVERDEDVLRELLTTNRIHLRREDMADIYGLPPDFKARGDSFAELPQGMRAGILTQPSWLIAQSGNFDNDPIHRGKWIRERLLGGTVPDLPISVDAVVPEDPHKTLRERLEVTRDSYCWSCHQKMNPLGMPFEKYDHMGHHRTTELEQPVRTDGEISLTGVSRLDGEVKDPIEMIHRMADSKHVQEVFVRHVFRYFLGRNETLRDAQTLQEANQAYEENGGSFRALVISLLSSDSFLYRINPEVDRLEGSQAANR